MNSLKHKIMYINQYTNTLYGEGEILELNIACGKDQPIKDCIFNLYARVITKSEEQRLVFYHLTYDKAEYSIPKLIKLLSEKYEKSERTYRRAIEYLIRKKIITHKGGVLNVNADYNLSLFDLDSIKGIIIHII